MDVTPWKALLSSEISLLRSAQNLTKKNASEGPFPYIQLLQTIGLLRELVLDLPNINRLIKNRFISNLDT